ncbi:type II 3-dehydroquinate dehydratase [Rubricoccus marinus]|uniref:3-dehydroquinate dehydratase n=1 Tax=Rubricoccus marinus TaxID=716817 RepID=A0A259U3C4_9BACT|nr:type II 3-dehydroquinate dehydratase [Rubricoccus marinus]OZC04328.1 type II 3-dehydroquinate dehydratase [Rubricoccus marinus]
MSSRPAVLVLNGPNLNRLGIREPEIYGAMTLADLETGLRADFPDLTLRFEQHNSEAGLIDALHAADTVETAGIVLNAAGYTHTSVVLRDAISSISTPVVEVHISNVYARESFRHTSLIAAVCSGVIAGFGVESYRMAVRHFADRP